MTRKPKTTAFWRGRLPHWEVEDGRYFVTMHLAGAIPEQGRDRIVTLARQYQNLPRNGERWLQVQRMIFGEMEDWLHRAEEARHLQDPEIAGIVVEAMEHRQTLGRWRLFEYVVMPSHIHCFFELGDARLKDVLEDFKRWTGHECMRRLGCTGGRFWQREWFDHWSRSDEEDEKIIHYIRQNPARAALVAHYLDWPYGSWSQP